MGGSGGTRTTVKTKKKTTTHGLMNFPPGESTFRSRSVWGNEAKDRWMRQRREGEELLFIADTLIGECRVERMKRATI